MKPGTESDLVWLKHIDECISEIHEYTGGKAESIHQSRAVQRAVERVLQILAESTQRLGPGLKATEPQIPWGKMAGLRNRLTHGYLYIDPDVIQDIVKKDLPQLAEAIRRMTGHARNSEKTARASRPKKQS